MRKKRRVHRRAGDEVYLAPGSGFCGESHLFKVLLPPDLDGLDENGRPDRYCPLGCGNENCREWGDVEIVAAPVGRDEAIGGYFCHVSECEMFDKPQVER